MAGWGDCFVNACGVAVTRRNVCEGCGGGGGGGAVTCPPISKCRLQGSDFHCPLHQMGS